MSSSRRRALLWSLVVALGMVVVLKSLGQPWWCKCGQPNLWTSDSVSSHNSQHLVDPYSFSHFQHGLAFYLVLWLMFGKRWSRSTRALMMLGLEAAWELFENTPFTIERYRAATISLDYYGDSVLNSIGDLAACALGYLFAATVPWWGTVAVYLTIEAGMLWFIRDSLLLNIVMLVYPLESIKAWQQS